MPRLPMAGLTVTGLMMRLLSVKRRLDRLYRCAFPDRAPRRHGSRADPGAEIALVDRWCRFIVNVEKTLQQRRFFVAPVRCDPVGYSQSTDDSGDAGKQISALIKYRSVGIRGQIHILVFLIRDGDLYAIFRKELCDRLCLAGRQLFSHHDWSHADQTAGLRIRVPEYIFEKIAGHGFAAGPAGDQNEIVAVVVIGGGNGLVQK